MNLVDVADGVSVILVGACPIRCAAELGRPYTDATSPGPPLDDEIHPAILTRLTDATGVEGWKLRPAPTARYSRGFAAVPDGSRSPEVFIKIYTRQDVRGSVAAARHEFAALQHLWTLRADHEFRTPRPIALEIDPPAIVMGFVPGRKLDEGLPRRLRILPSLIFGAAYGSSFRRLGCHLRDFAELPPREEGTPLGRCLDTCRARLTGEEFGRLVTPRIRERLRRSFEEAAECVDPAQVSGSGRHGDLGPWNILRAGSRLGLVDLERYGPGFLLQDLADLFGRLDRLVPVSGAPVKRIRQLKKAVSRGFGTIPGAQLALWPILRIGSALTLAIWERSYRTIPGDQRAVAEFLAASACESASEALHLTERQPCP